MKHIIVFITAPGKNEARKISNDLLDRRLIACANIIDKIDSYYWWNGKKARARECLVIAKTIQPAFKKLVNVVRCLHSYEVPEVIAVPIAAGYSPYMDWIEKNTNCRCRRKA